MAVANELTPYPFDPTGTMLANRVIGEQQIISPPNFKDYYFIIPKFAPFFGDDGDLVISVKDLENRTRILKEGVDYYITHRFIAASRATAKPIYGSITFLDKELAGVVTLTYQTIGGIWTLSADKILEILSNNLRNPRITSWDTVADVPMLFPVIDHEWNLVDMVGASEVVEAIDGITDALNSSNGNAITAHIADKNNPHNVTKVQIGLGSVQNFGLASISEAQQGISNAGYMTPALTYSAITKFAGEMVAGHANNTNNPHGTTATQVGLGNVQNYSVATPQEAVAGVLTTRYMTPATTKAVMDFFVTGQFAAHTNNKNNPHETTKAQVGLPLVENFGVATPDDARLGVRSDAYMTPLRTRQAIQAWAGGDLEAHSADKNNPHNVTKVQVGLGSVQNYGVADPATTVLGVATNLYTTPRGVVEAITTLANVPLDTHIHDTNNPHQTTKLHVGLGNVQNFAIADSDTTAQGQAVNLYTTPKGVVDAIRSLAITPLNAHINNTNNPHNVTKVHVGLGNVQDFGVADSDTTQVGLAVNLYTTPKGVVDTIRKMIVEPFAEHISDLGNPHQTTAEQVGAYTKQAVNQLLVGYLPVSEKAADTALFDGLMLWQVKDWVLAGKAGDSGMFGGRTPDEFKAWSLLGTASDSERLSGRTYQDIISAVGGSVDVQNRTAVQRLHTGTLPANPRTWSLIATMPIPTTGTTPATATEVFADGQFLVAGGDTGAEVESPLFHLRFSQRAGGVWAPNLWILDITGLTSSAQFGWVKNDVDQVYEIWMETSAGRNAASVTELNKGAGASKAQSDDDIVFVKPIGLVYGSIDAVARKSRVDNLEAQMIEVVQTMTAALQNMIPQ